MDVPSVGELESKVDGFEVSNRRGLAWVTCTSCGQRRSAGVPRNERAIEAVKDEHQCGGYWWHLGPEPQEEKPWRGLRAERVPGVNPTGGADL